MALKTKEQNINHKKITKMKMSFLLASIVREKSCQQHSSFSNLSGDFSSFFTSQSPHVIFPTLFCRE